MKKVYVLIGNYGSGKTELALNFAFRAAEAGKRTELLDPIVPSELQDDEVGSSSRGAKLLSSSPHAAKKASAKAMAKTKTLVKDCFIAALLAKTCPMPFFIRSSS